jgi:hypothetical protein
MVRRKIDPPPPTASKPADGADTAADGARAEGGTPKEDADPAGGQEHMQVCPRCGQLFDTRLLHQVIYHERPGHKPIELNS